MPIYAARMRSSFVVAGELVRAGWLPRDQQTVVYAPQSLFRHSRRLLDYYQKILCVVVRARLSNYPRSEQQTSRFADFFECASLETSSHYTILLLSKRILTLDSSVRVFADAIHTLYNNVTKELIICRAFERTPRSLCVTTIIFKQKKFAPNRPPFCVESIQINLAEFNCR